MKHKTIGILLAILSINQRDRLLDDVRRKIERQPTPGDPGGRSGAAIQYKHEERKNEASPWQGVFVKIKTGRGCVCWVKVQEMEVLGDLTGIQDATLDVTNMFGFCP